MREVGNVGVEQFDEVLKGPILNLPRTDTYPRNKPKTVKI
jgi:hypothetical protein